MEIQLDQLDELFDQVFQESAPPALPTLPKAPPTLVNRFGDVEIDDDAPTVPLPIAKVRALIDDDTRAARARRELYLFDVCAAISLGACAIVAMLTA